jgi:hypothetical protein
MKMSRLNYIIRHCLNVKGKMREVSLVCVQWILEVATRF